jgi:hypothetical protein
VQALVRTILSIALAYLLLPALAGAEASKPVLPVWENRGQPTPFGAPYATDAEGNVVVAVGEIDSSPYNRSTFNWFVRAYDARKGLTLWEDRLDVAGQRGTADAVAVHDGRAFVAGYMSDATLAPVFIVRAYTLGTGKLLWEKRLNVGYANAVVADGEQVYVAGGLLDTTTGELVGALIALDAQTGASIWESDTSSSADLNLNPNRFATAYAVRIQRDRVFVAGELTTSGTESGVSMYVQAHDRKTGAQLWEHQLPDAQIGPTSSVPLAVSDNWLVVGGAASTPNPNFPWDFRVTTLNAHTGALVWTDQVHRQAGGIASGLGFGAGKLFAYGWDCDDTVFNCHGDVRAYDPQSGTLQWEDRFTGPGGDIIIPIPDVAFKVNGNQVFLGTALLNLQGDDYVWTVRSYNGKNGSVRWQGQTDDGVGIGDAVSGLALSDGLLYAAGYASRPDGGYDFTVRAYQTDDDGLNDN